jgi:hypothetical protein
MPAPYCSWLVIPPCLTDGSLQATFVYCVTLTDKGIPPQNVVASTVMVCITIILGDPLTLFAACPAPLQPPMRR